MIKEWLVHRLTKDLQVDDPRTTELRRRIIQEKRFLRRIYEEWYDSIAEYIPPGEGAVLELGSGAGFLRDLVQDLITSEVFHCPHVQVVLDGQELPVADRSLRGIVMTDVFHHIPDPRRFFREASRCVRAGGVVCMIEPWVTRWSRIVYSNLHPEPFLPETKNWGFSPGGPLSGANGAQPWIVFERDRDQFEAEFPAWNIQVVELIMPFRYLISGGVSLRSTMPDWSFGFWTEVENSLRPWMKSLAMFAKIVLRRVN